MTQALPQELTMTDLYRPEYIEDPYPLYRRFRDAGRVAWDRQMGENGAWMVTGYEQALLTLTDSRYSARRPQWDPEQHDEKVAGPMRALHTQVFVSDAPDHQRVRSLLTKPFLPRAVARMRPDVERAADMLLDAVADRGEMDFMGDFALALPAAMVCRVLGIPKEDRGRVWRYILSWGLLVDEGPMSKENPEAHLAALGKYMDFFRKQLDRRRTERHDDLMQTLADSWAAGEFASEEELLGNLIFMLTAGQTTTAHQIGNTTLSLLANPDVLAQIQDDPGLVPAATPELMRYDSSVQLTKRRTTEEMELDGVKLGAGDELYVWIGAAHRDPEAFQDPDRLDINRPKKQNLSLGHGAHYCLGGQLGQLVNEVAIQRFAERIRNPQVDRAKIGRTLTPTFRGPHSMPMTFS